MGSKDRLRVLLATNVTREYTKTYHRHFSVTKLVPEIFDGIQTNKGCDEKANELDTANAPDADTSHKQPEEPLRLKAVMSLIVEFSPAENSSHSTAKKHRVEENKTTNGSVGVFAENHQGHKPNTSSSKVEFASGEVGHGDTHNPKEGIECSHEGIVDFFGVFVTGFEFESTVITSEDT